MHGILLKRLTIAVLFLFAFSVTPVHAIGAGNATESIGYTIISITASADGKVIEKGRLGKTEIETITYGTKCIATMKNDETTQIIETDQLDYHFSITTNGDKVTYDLNDFIIEEFKFDPPQLIDSDFYKLESDPYYGSPYNNILCGTKVITYPTTVTAKAYESYYFYRINHMTWSEKAFTALSIVFAVASLPWSTLVAALSGSIAIIDGVETVITAVYGEKTDTRQRWDRYSIILNDGGTWAEEYMTRDSKIAALNGVDYGPYTLSEFRTSHYYDILDHSINMFLLYGDW